MLVRQLFRFGIVGVVVNVVLYLFYLLQTEFGVASKVAMTVSYALGVVIGFSLNKTWTFQFKGHVSKTFQRYVLAYFLGYVFNLTALYLFVDLLYLAHQISQGVIMIVLAGLFFLAQKFWIFPHDRDESVT